MTSKIIAQFSIQIARIGFNILFLQLRNILWRWKLYHFINFSSFVSYIVEIVRLKLFILDANMCESGMEDRIRSIFLKRYLKHQGRFAKSMGMRRRKKCGEPGEWRKRRTTILRQNSICHSKVLTSHCKLSLPSKNWISPLPETELNRWTFSAYIEASVLNQNQSMLITLRGGWHLTSTRTGFQNHLLHTTILQIQEHNSAI